MKHILVIADPVGSEQFAFQKALSMAETTYAKVHAVTFCYESFNEMGRTHKSNDSTIDLKQVLIEHAKSEWLDITARSPPEDVTHEVIWEKYIHQWVVEHCKTNRYDLIVKTGHRSEGFFYTPTDWHLFRESTVPIYCISKPDYKAKKVVLAALDLTSKQKEKRQLNDVLLEAAFQLSIQTNSTLHCCYGIQIPTIIKTLEAIDVAARIHQTEDRLREESKSWLDLYGIKASNLHLREGKPENVINHFARKLKAQCVVIGSMGRTGIEGKLIGNTAEKVIHSAKADLLVI